MNTGRKVFAVIFVQDGKIVVDLGNTADYETVTTKEGIICIVERESQEYIAIEKLKFSGRTGRKENMFEKKNEKSNSSCEDCMHYVICGHKDHMKRVLEQVDALEIEKSKFIKITAMCTEFREIVAMPRGGSSVR